MAVGNLELVTSVAVTTAVNNFSVDNCFTTNYEVYIVKIDDMTTGANAIMQFRFLDSAGSVISTSNYDRAILSLRDSAAFAEYRNTNTAQMGFESVGASPEGYSGILYVYNPANTSSYTFFQQQATGYTSSLVRGTKGIGVLNLSAEHRGINLFLNTSTFQSGQVSIYGVK